MFINDTTCECKLEQSEPSASKKCAKLTKSHSFGQGDWMVVEKAYMILVIPSGLFGSGVGGGGGPQSLNPRICQYFCAGKIIWATYFATKCGKNGN